jgi:hypothetical protein
MEGWTSGRIGFGSRVHESPGFLSRVWRVAGHGFLGSTRVALPRRILVLATGIAPLGLRVTASLPSSSVGSPVYGSIGSFLLHHYLDISDSSLCLPLNLCSQLNLYLSISLSRLSLCLLGRRRRKKKKQRRKKEEAQEKRERRRKL